MATITNRLHPYRVLNEHEVINLYSLMLGSGDAGTLVKIVSTAANPSDNDGWSTTNVGASVAGAVSLRYETKGKITPTVSGDDKHDALGLTLFDTRESDENALPLKLFPQRAKEIFAVRSGEAVPVATRGTFGIWGKYVDTSLAVPTPGYPVVISRSGDGKLAAIDPSNATQYNLTGGVALNGQIYTADQVVGKWISTSGSQFASQGGFYFFRLTL